MSFAFTLTRHVRADLATARLWYDREKPGLGADLAGEFYAAIEVLRHAPTAQTPFGNRFRKRRLRVFPYSVYFHVADAELFVVALIHRRRSSEFVLEQLQRP